MQSKSTRINVFSLPFLTWVCRGLPQVTAVGAVDSSHARRRHIWCGAAAAVKHKHKAAGYEGGNSKGYDAPGGGTWCRPRTRATLMCSASGRRLTGRVLEKVSRKVEDRKRKDSSKNDFGT